MRARLKQQMVTFTRVCVRARVCNGPEQKGELQLFELLSIFKYKLLVKLCCFFNARGGLRCAGDETLRMNLGGVVVTLIRMFLLCQRIKRLEPLRHARGGACDRSSTHAHTHTRAGSCVGRRSAGQPSVDARREIMTLFRWV